MYEFKEICYGYLLSKDDAEFFNEWLHNEEEKINNILKEKDDIICKLKNKNRKLKNDNYKLRKNSKKLYDKAVDTYQFKEFLVKENSDLIKTLDNIKKNFDEYEKSHMILKELFETL